MKKLLLSVFALAALSGQAQLANGTDAPDFTVTDVNGVQHHLYSYLNSGKNVYLNISATWCGPCWNYHNSHALAYFYEAYGPSGSNEAMVLYVEGDGSTPVSALYGEGNNTLGNWVEGTPYPIIDNAAVATSYAITYFPTLYRICANTKKVTLLSQSTAPALRNGMNNNCGTMTGVSNHAKIYGGDLFSCSYSESNSKSFSFRNLGNNNITQATVVLKANGNVVASQDYTGNLSQFNTANVTFSNVNITPGANYTVELQSVNGGQNFNTSFSSAPVNVFVAAVSSTTALTVKTYLDNYAAEASWKIKDSNGAVIATSNTYTGSHSNSIQTQQITVPGNDCYSIELYDTYGDGWGYSSGQTGVEILENNNSLVFVDGKSTFSQTAPKVRPAAFRHGSAGIEDLNLAHFSVYPNPSNGVFNLSASEQAAITITDISGKIVFQSNVVEGETSINLSGFQSGIYLMNIKGQTIHKTEKLVIK